MFEELFLCLIYDVLHLPDTHIELLRKWIVANTIYEPSFKDLPVPLGMHPLVYQVFYLRVGYIRELDLTSSLSLSHENLPV